MAIQPDFHSPTQSNKLDRSLKESSKFLALPNDILLHIFSTDPMLEPICRFVCRRFNAVLPIDITASVASRFFCFDAAKRGYHRVLQWALTNKAPWHSACAGAAAGGDLVLLNELRTKGAPWGSTLYQAMIHNQPNVLEWVINKKIEFDYDCLYDGIREASERGHIPILSWLLEKGFIKSTDQSLCMRAAGAGQLAVLQWAFEEGFALDSEVHENAACGNHTPILEWFLKIGFHPTAKVCFFAAGRGDLSPFLSAKAHGFAFWDTKMCAAAAEGGHLELLQWLKAQDAPMDESVCAAAAWGGHLELLKWVKAQGAPWDESTCVNASEMGHIEVLKWILFMCAPRSPLATKVAAANGHLEILNLLHASNVPWHPMTVEAAVTNGHLNTFQYATQHGAPRYLDTCRTAAEGGHVSILEYMKQQGYPINLKYICRCAASHGQLPVLRWVKDQGFLLNAKISFYAASEGHFEILMWAHANEVPLHRAVFKEAIEGWHHDIVKWALKNLSLNNKVCKRLVANGYARLLDRAKAERSSLTLSRNHESQSSQSAHHRG